ncbi:MAG TPA: glycosyltransferase family 2 protein [Chloroflexota bacterium]|nr:glycosyltransferase family 2 protein [Chloroflexota bacterium]
MIVPYNVRTLLHNCLDAVRRSAAPFPFETIVVDTGLDGSAAMARREYPEMTVLEAPENPGYAAANNLGIRRARGEHVLLLNPDTVVPPDAFARAVAELERDSSVGILGVKLVRGDGSLDLACRRSFPTPRTALYHFLRLPKLFPRSARFGQYNLTDRDPDREYDVDAVAGAFLLIRRAVLERIGLLDESFWMYGEDLDLCWRAKAAGWRTRYYPRVTVLHLKGESSKSRSVKCTYEFFRAMHLFYGKHYAAAAPSAQNALVTTAIVALGAASLASGRLRPAGLRRVS